jgi:hypothetical protein
VPEAPSDIEFPLSVNEEFESLSLAIEPVNWSFVTDVSGNVTVFEDKSMVEDSLALVSVPSSNSWF